MALVMNKTNMRKQIRRAITTRIPTTQPCIVVQPKCLHPLPACVPSTLRHSTNSILCFSIRLSNNLLQRCFSRLNNILYNDAFLGLTITLTMMFFKAQQQPIQFKQFDHSVVSRVHSRRYKFSLITLPLT